MLNSQLFAQCGHLWPSSVFKHSPVDEFQILTVLSLPPLASSPALDQATVFTLYLWPFNPLRRSPFVGSHRMIFLSSPPLARTLPSYDQATVLT